VTTAQVVLEYLKVFLSWPVVILAISVLFLVRFKAPISALIGRIASIKIPGGGEVLMPQQQQAAMNAIEQTSRPAGDVPAPSEGATELDHVTSDERLDTERERARLWEFRFLNSYLVLHTQLVLQWLASREPTAYGTYDTHWMYLIPEANERSAVIRALQNHHLISVSPDRQNMLRVTGKGREYLEWRGPIAPPPAPSVAPPSPKPPSLTGLEKIASLAAIPSTEVQPDPDVSAPSPENR
jgi:hypothetical protein